MDSDTTQQISQLQGQVNALSQKLETMSKSLIEHQHTGYDGSVGLNETSLFLKEGKPIVSGCTGIVGGQPFPNPKKYFFGAWSTGPETNSTVQSFGSGTDNSQVTIQHDKTDGPLGLSFMYPMRKPQSVTCSMPVTIGQTIVNIPGLDLGDDNSKAGYYLFLRRVAVSPNDPTDYGYTIASNTGSSVTLTSGITFSGTVSNIIVSDSIYFGSSVMQWKKLYTLNGVRFGPGESYNGQNGLLYMDSSGALQYTNPSGVTAPVGGGGTYTTASITISGTNTTGTTAIAAGAKITGYWIANGGVTGTPTAAWVELVAPTTTLACLLSAAPGVGNSITITVGLLY